MHAIGLHAVSEVKKALKLSVNERDDITTRFGTKSGDCQLGWPFFIVSVILPNFMQFKYILYFASIAYIFLLFAYNLCFRFNFLLSRKHQSVTASSLHGLPVSAKANEFQILERTTMAILDRSVMICFSHITNV